MLEIKEWLKRGKKFITEEYKNNEIIPNFDFILDTIDDVKNVIICIEWWQIPLKDIPLNFYIYFMSNNTKNIIFENKFLKSKSFSYLITGKESYFAAENDLLELFTYLLENNYKFDKLTMILIKNFKSMDCYNYITNNGGDFEKI